ncbi:MAG: hypothetical protein OXI76_03375 [Gemmatimonadota bacterium]|nr:hypothetical protein [Gemmatimonadota bacterium]
MFDLNAEVRCWRERRERQTSLSPRELDELEDHLRARVDLEMEIDRVLRPERAFAIARRELGKPAALEKEFAKAGKPRWRRWLVAGWAVFAASFVLPVVPDFLAPGWVPGWGAAILPLTALAFWPPPSLLDLVPVLSSLTNLLMFATLLELRTPRPRRTRWLAALASGAAVLNLQWLLGWAEPVVLPPLGMGIGYWAWTASFFCVAAALWMRVRELKPATPKPIGGSIA